jgi:hypothetical protein
MKFNEIRSYDNYILANLQLSLLKDHGINCYLQDENTVTIDPLLSPAIGGIKLMVADAETDKAIGLLEEAEERYIRELPCPKCGAATLEKVTHVEQPAGFWGRLRVRLFTGSPVRFTVHYRCKNCGTLYSSLPA